MTIEDHYQRRREHQQALLAEAQEQRFASSSDPRIQKAPPPYRALFSVISRWIVWLRSEPANPIEYAKSVVLNKVSGDLLKMMKKMEMKPKRNQFISIGITVKGRPTPITYYSEKELEEKTQAAPA